MDATQLESITQAAMTLPEQDRAKLARDLVASLDGPADVGVAESWDAEISRRIHEVTSGNAKLMDPDDVIARARDRIRD